MEVSCAARLLPDCVAMGSLMDSVIVMRPRSLAVCLGGSLAGAAVGVDGEGLGDGLGGGVAFG